MHFWTNFRVDSKVPGSGGFKGGEIFLPKGFDPLRPKGSSFCTIMRYPFLASDRKVVLKAPFYTYVEGEAR